MPSCQSCSADAVDASIAELESTAPLIFVYPDEIDTIPIEQLPQGSNSVALTTRDVTGLSSVDYGLTPAILAINEDSSVVAQTDPYETFEHFRQRVER